MIPTFDYRRGLPELEPKVIEAVRRVLHSNQLILGPETSGFEQEFAAWLGARHCIAVTSGTAALHVALLALELPAGAEVLTTANTCMPTAAAIVASGCQPRFVDVDADTLMMDAQRVEASLGDRTACMIPVHLWGNAVDMGPLLEIAARHGLPVIEDCAQAAGTRYGDRSVGLWGDLGCFSFYPTKNLGAYGEGGAIVTNNDELADRCREIRAYGARDGLAVRPGLNARISEIQAAILRVKLPLLDRHNARRREIAGRYDEQTATSFLRGVATTPDVRHAYHQYVVRCPRRDALKAHLLRQGVATSIHYPVPLHRMPAFESGGRHGDLPNTEQAAGEILSLPVHPELSDQEVARIVDAVRCFDASSE